MATKSRLADLTKPSSNGRGPALFSPDGERLAHASGGLIKIWDARTLAPYCQLTNGFDAISLSFSPDSRTLAAAGLDLQLEGITNRLVFWDIATKRKINKLAVAAPFAALAS